MIETILCSLVANNLTSCHWNRCGRAVKDAQSTQIMWASGILKWASLSVCYLFEIVLLCLLLLSFYLGHLHG